MAEMNQLSFAAHPFEYEKSQNAALVPLIDSVSLIELISKFEEGRGYDCSGKYAGLVPAFFRFGPLDISFAGKTGGEHVFGSPGKIALLGCEGGEVGCWPLLADVLADGNVVRWSTFEQPFRKERDYSEFGPFTFQSSQYAEALAELTNQLAIIQRQSTR